MHVRWERVTGAGVALAAFGIAIIAGLRAGNPAAVILGRALVAALICHVACMLLGAACRRALERDRRAVEEPEVSPEVAEVVASAGTGRSASPARPAASAGSASGAVESAPATATS